MIKLKLNIQVFIFTHKYNEKLLEALRKLYMIQETDREENFEEPAVPPPYWGPNGGKWAFGDLDKRKRIQICQ